MVAKCGDPDYALSQPKKKSGELIDGPARLVEDRVGGVDGELEA